ncbi:hypothetical protein SAMN05519103_09466 [Rhizobiales bacterium GAS113]|nr:hypothetical protein SAMN05519103_09466 [Rhizobiales bacterium GAS113]
MKMPVQFAPAPDSEVLTLTPTDIRKLGRHAVRTTLAEPAKLDDRRIVATVRRYARESPLSRLIRG